MYKTYGYIASVCNVSDDKSRLIPLNAHKKSMPISIKPLIVNRRAGQKKTQKKNRIQHKPQSKPQNRPQNRSQNKVRSKQEKPQNKARNCQGCGVVK
jgi:hypothetical protein